jgi:hypothetical protein
MQATTLRRALDTTVEGEPLLSAAEVTWNLLEPLGRHRSRGGR